MVKSKREQALKTSREVEKYLDQYYSGKINSTRITNRADQLRGIDIVIKTDNSPDLLVDEKCATDYINKDLQTFSFELRSTSYNSGHRYDGWLISDRVDTSHYMICYINKADFSDEFKSEDIREMEVLLISKKAILSYLSSKGLDSDTLQNRCNDIDNGDITRGNIKNGWKFSKSGHKMESPINILIPRTELRKLSIHNDIIIT